MKSPRSAAEPLVIPQDTPLRIAIFSDVHANIDALATSLALMRDQKVDTYACLGDVVGYGGDPDACCTLVREIAEWTVIGNHDAAVAQRMEYEYYYSSARDALNLHREMLSEENLTWLQSLPMIVWTPEFAFCHGRPDKPEAFEYMFNDGHAQALMDVYSELAPVTFIGHSHLTRAYRLEAPDQIRDVSGRQIHLDANAKYVITVGSIGQPRDHDPRACFVVYDTETRTVDFFRTPYDVRAAALRIWTNDRLSPEFAKRLYLGV